MRFDFLREVAGCARQAGRLCLVAGAGLFGLAEATAVPAAAQTPTLDVRALTGQWDMALADTPRKCRLTLHEAPGVAAHPLAMPAGCRRAMPVLAAVNAWNTANDALVMLDREGQPVLNFAPRDDGLAATGPQGETYSLLAAEPRTRKMLAQQAKPPAVDGTVTVQAAPAPAAPPVAAPAPTPAAPPAAAAPVPAPAAALKPADLAGRYAVLREAGKETGCTIAFDEKAKGPKGTLKALLAPSCRDQGIVIFDPVGWSFDKGRLILTAKKGHQAHFDHQADGSWSKDGKEGHALSLRKM